MRSASVALTNALKLPAVTLARLWKVTRADGVVLYFTDHDQPITFDGHTYRADVSFTCSALVTTDQFVNAQSVTLTIAMDPNNPTDANGFNESDLRARKYDRAVGVVSFIDYTNPAGGIAVVYTGVVGQIKIYDKNRAQIELVAQASAAGTSIGNEVYQATCRNAFGDSLCTVDIEARAVDLTVLTVTGLKFTAAALTQVDQHWLQGFVRWTTGANAGTAQLVAASKQSETSVTLAGAPLKAIAPGDTGRVFMGCDKQCTTCLNVFNNIANFNAEPFAPASIALEAPYINIQL